MRVIGIGSLDSAEQIAAFVDRHGLDIIDHISDPDGAIRQRLGVRGQPSWMFIDGETGQVERVVGALDADELLRRIGQLAAA